MSVPYDSNAPIADLPPGDSSAANAIGRIAAFIAGLLVLAVGSMMSLGTVLVGAAGMGIVTLVRHRRRQRLTRFGGWIASTASVAAIVAIFIFVISLIVPANTWSQVRAAADSAQAASAKEPPPAWVDRMYPGMSERAAGRRRAFSPTTQSAFMMAGLGMAATFFVGFFGTVGWGAGMLIGFGARGSWPGASAAVDPEPLPYR